MPKCSIETMNSRKEELVDACEKLYQTKTFGEITLKEIGDAAEFTRTAIYSYFQTKEEIFLALLQREYSKWIAELVEIEKSKVKFTAPKLAVMLARSLQNRVQLLKLLSMNLYAIEENSRDANLIEFKKVYKASVDAVDRCFRKLRPKAAPAESYNFTYQFFPFIYGIYPYVFPSDKQIRAMKTAGMKLKKRTVYQLAYPAILKMLR
ncbi:TetR/AcrR family transcriptional regulator [bacterium]|nr:TetR/AcrR family transcriptional regulator [bacterium]